MPLLTLTLALGLLFCWRVMCIMPCNTMRCDAMTGSRMSTAPVFGTLPEEHEMLRKTCRDFADAVLVVRTRSLHPMHAAAAATAAAASTPTQIRHECHRCSVELTLHHVWS